jgi:DNA-binding SARP family transcriptional activator
VETGQPRQRAVLAALTVDVGRLVTVAALVDRVWGDEPPPGARRSLYSHIARVRRTLASANAADGPDQATARLDRATGGYLLDLPPDAVDLHRFRRLVGRARDSGGPQRLRLLREAQGLWRGEPLAGVPGPWAQRMRESWRQEYLDATVEWAQSEVLDGRPGTVVGRLTDLLAEYPLVESLAAAVMRALYAAGRSAEALDRYAVIRQRLVDQLGTDPGGELQRLHLAILRGESATLRGDSDQPRIPDQRPAQLPLDGYGFSGRVRELAQLDAILAKMADQPTSVIVSVVYGMAGVGKTALAVHWAHRVKDRFPDGQLYVNLRGGTDVALRGFLDALGMPADRIPSGVDAQAAMYRSLLAGQRVLVVLDDARSPDQVRPLLPGSPGCLVVVTSRGDMSGLVVAEGAHPLRLGLLPPAEARQLLVRRLGADRVAAQPRAVDEIIAECAQLPLALAGVAARAAAYPGLSLEAFARRAAAGGHQLFANFSATTPDETRPYAEITRIRDRRGSGGRDRVRGACCGGAR